MGKASFKKIRLKLIVVFVAAVLSVLCLILILNARQAEYIRQNSSLSTVIDISGRQRMLSQNITKNVLLLATHIHDDGRLQTLDSLKQLFRQSHELLLHRNQQLQDHMETAQRLDSLFASLAPSFIEILEGSDGVLQASDDSVRYILIGKLLQEESVFLPQMDRITREYAELGNDILEKINTNDSVVNAIIILALFISIGITFFYTISTLRSYSDNLERIQQKLIKSVDEARFRIEKMEFFTSSIKVGIWERSVEEQTEFWSDELYYILGYEPGEVEGTFANFVKVVHPEDTQKLMDASDVSRNTGLSSTVELRVHTKGGEYKWVEATGNVRRTQDGQVSMMVGGIIDINDRKKLESQLRVFVENAPAPIAMFNKNMEYIAVSQRWMEQYKITDRVIIGVSHYEVFPDLADEWREIFGRSLQSGEVAKQDQDLFYTQDGTFQWLKWEVRPWYQNADEVGGLLMFTEDITRDKERNEELRQAKEQAEQASKAKEQFLATMSHEIRTPLNAINSLTQILLSESPRQDQMQHLNLLRFSGDNLLTLVNDILDISKIEAGKLTLEKTSFDLYYMIESIRRSLAYRAQENMVEIATLYDEQLPRYFAGDVTRITQIIYNLAGNAIKFTKDGKVTIQVKAIGREQKRHTFRVSVRDTGIGISPQNQEKIFGSFEQADSGTTRQYGGSGLGLYITKTLLQMMGSEIQLKSTLGKGSDFYFDLTLDESESGIKNVSRSYSEDPNFSNRNIYVLVAEDSPANQYIMKKFLAKIGVRFDIVGDGEQAVEYVNQGKYDLILMDLQMPVMDGYTATIKIRSNKSSYFQQIPIIALTADAFLDIKKKTLAIGMTDYLSKPFKPADLYALLDHYSGRVKKRSPPQSQLEAIVSTYGGGDATFVNEFVSGCVDEYETYLRVLRDFGKNHHPESLHIQSQTIKAINRLLEQEELTEAIDGLLAGVDGEPVTERVDLVMQRCFQVISELNLVKIN